MRMIRGAHNWRFYDDGGPLTVFARTGEDGAVTELYIKARTGEVSAAALRRLPLARMRALNVPRPDIEGVMRGLFGDQPAPDVEETIRTNAFPPGWARKRGATTGPSDYQLTPKSAEGGLTDDFLKSVADAYNAAVSRGERPNRSLQEQTGYPIRTVERWVYMARKKGHLPPTRPGSVG